MRKPPSRGGGTLKCCKVKVDIKSAICVLGNAIPMSHHGWWMESINKAEERGQPIAFDDR